MNRLTDRQQETLDVIRLFIEQNGYPPTVAEVSTALRCSGPAGAYDNIRALERKGYIRRDAETARGIRIIDGSGPSRGVFEEIVSECRQLGFVGNVENLARWLKARLGGAK